MVVFKTVGLNLHRKKDLMIAQKLETQYIVKVIHHGASNGKTSKQCADKFKPSS